MRTVGARVLGMDIGPSEAETFWTEFLRRLTRRGLRGVKLVISDAHEGIKAAVAKLMNATGQRCRVHTMRNALAHAGKSSRRVVSAFMATAFAQDSAEAAKAQWRRVADQLRPKLPKLAGFMDEAEDDVLAYMSFPPDHWSKIHSTNGLERLNGEVRSSHASDVFRPRPSRVQAQRDRVILYSVPAADEGQFSLIRLGRTR
jgi:putative transposase